MQEWEHLVAVITNQSFLLTLVLIKESHGYWSCQDRVL